MSNTKHYLIKGDSHSVLEELPEKLFDMMITSPPYKLSKKYEEFDDKMQYFKYLEFLKESWRKVYRSLKPDGRVAINIGDAYKIEREPTHIYIGQQLKDIGYKFRDQIIWDKGQVSNRTAWGSFKSPSDPYLVNPCEYIMVYYKEKTRHIGDKDDIDIDKQDFIDWSLGVWRFPGETNQKHPAGVQFPLELPKRLIQFFTYQNDWILDPFMGVGTTNLAAKKHGRNSVGIDLSEECCKIAKERMGQKELGKEANFEYIIWDNIGKEKKNEIISSMK